MALVRKLPTHAAKPKRRYKTAATSTRGSAAVITKDCWMIWPFTVVLLTAKSMAIQDLFADPMNAFWGCVIMIFHLQIFTESRPYQRLRNLRSGLRNSTTNKITRVRRKDRVADCLA